MKNRPPARGVSPATAMEILERMEREEAALPDGTESTGAEDTPSFDDSRTEKN